MSFSDYIIYVDESGDHGLKNIDQDYPVFCLAFCIIEKTRISEYITPALTALKHKYWGHDNINFHASDIRKQIGDFTFLRTNQNSRESFFNDLNSFIEKTEMHIISSVINKNSLTERYKTPYNPYEISLLFCMEELTNFLIKNNQENKIAHVIFESRGPKEDNELELEFQRICNNQGSWGCKSVDFKKIQFKCMFVKKEANLPGLQLSDLVARPVGLKTLRPQQENRSWDIIASKIIATKSFP
jgi:hypothetical protein